MLTLPDLAAKAECFLWGHSWDRGRCSVCGEVERRGD